MYPYPNDVHAFVKVMQRFYLRTNRFTGVVDNDPNVRITNDPYLIPNAIVDLLVFLEDMQAKNTELINQIHSESPGDINHQTVIDNTRFGQRLKVYRERTDLAIEQGNGDKFMSSYNDVVGYPLIVGLYPGENVSRIPDMITPLTIANQIDAEWPEPILTRLISAIRDTVAEIPGRVTDAIDDVRRRSSFFPMLMIGTAVAVGAGIMLGRKSK